MKASEPQLAPIEYCYLMTDGHLFKIGKSVSPKKRLASLKTANPNINLICFSDNVTESQMHKLYYKHRVRGEWFDLNEEQVKRIISIMGMNEAEVKYDIQPIIKRQKTYKRREINKDKCIIPFGKYKGEFVNDIDDVDYLRWMKGILHDKMSNYERKVSVLYNSVSMRIKEL
jgi:hypothetical protein